MFGFIFRMFCCVAYVENGRKQQSTVPKSWVNCGSLSWPPHDVPKSMRSKWFNTCEAPKPNWPCYPGCTILFEGKLSIYNNSLSLFRQIPSKDVFKINLSTVPLGIVGENKEFIIFHWNKNGHF